MTWPQLIDKEFFAAYIGAVSLAFGAKQAVENCMHLSSADRLVIITDQQSLKIGEALRTAAQAINAQIHLFIMEDFGSRPVDGSTPLALPEKIREAYLTATASILAAQGKKGELHSFRRPLLHLITERKIKHAHMIGITEQLMEEGMGVDYARVAKVTHAVHEIARRAKKIHVTAPAGTELVATFDPRLKWIPCDAQVTPEKWTNLPDGETFTSPLSVDGHVVVDGVLGDFFSEKYGSLEAHPLSFDLKGGWVVKQSVACANKELEHEFRDYLNMDENASRIGEFAIGTNIGLTKLVGNMLQDEKFPGIHMAVGDPYPETTGANWHSKAHCDGVLRKTTIDVDGRMIMKHGKFTSETV